jgi:hypothetical protein
MKHPRPQERAAAPVAPRDTAGTPRGGALNLWAFHPGTRLCSAEATPTQHFPGHTPARDPNLSKTGRKRPEKDSECRKFS